MNHMSDFYNLHIIGLVVKRSTNATHNMTPIDLYFRFKPEVENFTKFISQKLRHILT